MGNSFIGTDMRGVCLAQENLSLADLSLADLSLADLSGANLSGANLSGANLSGAVFRGANLSGANLSGAVLRGAFLYQADLTGANLMGAVVRVASLHMTNLSGANLEGATFTGSVLDGATGPIMAARDLGRHWVWATPFLFGVGCLVHPYAHWMKAYWEIAQRHNYTAEDVQDYLPFFEAARKALCLHRDDSD